MKKYNKGITLITLVITILFSYDYGEKVETAISSSYQSIVKV